MFSINLAIFITLQNAKKFRDTRQSSFSAADEFYSPKIRTAFKAVKISEAVVFLFFFSSRGNSGLSYSVFHQREPAGCAVDTRHFLSVADPVSYDRFHVNSRHPCK